MRINAEQMLKEKNIKVPERGTTRINTAIDQLMAGNRKFVTEKRIDLTLLEVSPENRYHYTEEELTALVKNISSVGLMERLIVEEKNGKYLILSGQKRFLAIQRIAKEDPEAYRKFFGDNKILCAVWDLQTAAKEAAGLSPDILRSYLISSANLQHEKTTGDYMMRLESEIAFYQEMKSSGNVPSGTLKRDYIAEHMGIAARSTQKLLSAKEKLDADLWETLKDYPGLESVSQLDKIAGLDRQKQWELLDRIRAGEQVNLEQFAKAPAKKQSLQTSQREMTQYFRPELLSSVASDLEQIPEMSRKDIDKLAKIGTDLQKQLLSAEKIIRKYRPNA